MERGTPASITADAFKFVDWVAKDTGSAETEEEHGGLEKVDESRETHEAAVENYEPPAKAVEAPMEEHLKTPTADGPVPAPTGVIASLTNAVQAGIQSYAPDVVRNNMPISLSSRDKEKDAMLDYEGDTTDTDSTLSFESAHQFHTAEERLHDSSSSTTPVDDASTSHSSLGMIASAVEKVQDALTPHEREMEKLESKRKSLESKFLKQQEERRARGEEQSERETREQEKRRERHKRDVQKAQDRHDRELRKLEERRKKELKKLELKQRREAEKDAVVKANRERDDERKRAEKLDKENKELREQVGELQREVTMLVRKLGMMDGGDEVLRSVKREVSRTASPASARSIKAGTTT